MYIHSCDGIVVKNVRRDSIGISAQVHISGTFYAWVTQYVGEMTIVAPDHVRKAYAEYLQKAIELHHSH